MVRGMVNADADSDVRHVHAIGSIGMDFSVLLLFSLQNYWILEYESFLL